MRLKQILDAIQRRPSASSVPFLLHVAAQAAPGWRSAWPQSDAAEVLVQLTGTNSPQDEWNQAYGQLAAMLTTGARELKEQVQPQLESPLLNGNRRPLVRREQALIQADMAGEAVKSLCWVVRHLPSAWDERAEDEELSLVHFGLQAAAGSKLIRFPQGVPADGAGWYALWWRDVYGSEVAGFHEGTSLHGKLQQLLVMNPAGFLCGEAVASWPGSPLLAMQELLGLSLLSYDEAAHEHYNEAVRSAAVALRLIEPTIDRNMHELVTYAGVEDEYVNDVQQAALDLIYAAFHGQVSDSLRRRVAAIADVLGDMHTTFLIEDVPLAPTRSALVMATVGDSMQLMVKAIEIRSASLAYAGEYAEEPTRTGIGVVEDENPGIRAARVVELLAYAHAMTWEPTAQPVEFKQTGFATPIILSTRQGKRARDGFLIAWWRSLQCLNANE